MYLIYDEKYYLLFCEKYKSVNIKPSYSADKNGIFKGIDFKAFVNILIKKLVLS